MTLEEFVEKCLSMGATMDSEITVSTVDGTILLEDEMILVDSDGIDIDAMNYY